MSLELYRYQVNGVRFLHAAGSALVADDMGVGKTVQSVITLAEDKLFPALVVCPNSVKSTWAAEFAKWTPGVDVRVAGNGTETAKRAIKEVSNGFGDVLVLNWEALRALSRLAPYGSIRLEPCRNCDPNSTRAPHLCQREDKILNTVRWAAVVADEAHRGKNPKADQTRALWAVGARTPVRIALTGSPVERSAEDLWAIMHFVAPDEYPNKWPFINRYALTTPNFFSGGVDVLGLRPDRREELDKFFLPRFLRRTKAEVLPHLPPKVYERREITLTGRQKKAYDAMSKEMVAAIKGGTLVADNALTASLRLRQLASAYGTLLQGGEVKLEEPSSKLDVLEEVLVELGDQKAVIFAESSQLIRLAYDRVEQKYPSLIMTGATPAGRARDDIIAAFQADAQFLFATVGVIGEGVDGLQVASVGIFLQRPWSNTANRQAEDRLHRIGQEGDSVLYIDLVTKDTIEDRVFEALDKKAAALQDVVRDPKEDARVS